MQENVFDLKKICAEKGGSFFRTNIEDGEGIDIVGFTQSFPESYPVCNSDYIILCPVTQENPWIAAKNIEDIAKTNGKVVLDVLWFENPWLSR